MQVWKPPAQVEPAKDPHGYDKGAVLLFRNAQFGPQMEILSQGPIAQGGNSVQTPLLGTVASWMLFGTAGTVASGCATICKIKADLPWT